MIDNYKESLRNQFASAFSTLDQCVQLCPDDAWQAPVVSLTFSQATFHVLFFTDVYLGVDLASVKQQPFHQENAEFFADYEELEDRVQQAQYSKPDITKYLQHCAEKADAVIQSETEETLAVTPGFDWLDFSRAEVHLYNLRHLYHHAGQLSMKLRQLTGDGARWIRSGKG